MKICYNPRVMIRALVVSFALFVSPVALAADATTTTSGAADVAVSGTAGAMGQATPAAGGMRPGVAPPPKAKHPYFFAAYAAVWAGIFGYALWLGSRISSLEQKVTSVTDRSR